MDVSVSAGGRVARVHMHVERQRKLTSMRNTLEVKRYRVIQRQIEDDKIAEINIWRRRSKDILKYSDDMKAFQKALLRRLSDVKEMNKTSGIRPLVNLGRYGGVPVNQIKSNIDQFRPVRNPTQRRLLKTKFLLQAGKSTGRIKSFDPKVIGDIAQSIMQLEKAKKPESSKDVIKKGPDEDVNDSEQNEEQKDVILRRRRLVLPPIQVSRTMRPNANYHRRMAEETRDGDGNRRRSVLPKIPEERAPTDDFEKEDHDSTKSPNFEDNFGTRKSFYKWNFLKPRPPELPKNYLTNTQRFWKQGDSVTAGHSNIVLPIIK